MISLVCTVVGTHRASRRWLTPWWTPAQTPPPQGTRTRPSVLGLASRQGSLSVHAETGDVGDDDLTRRHFNRVEHKDCFDPAGWVPAKTNEVGSTRAVRPEVVTMSSERDKYRQCCLLVERRGHVLRKRPQGLGEIGGKRLVEMADRAPPETRRARQFSMIWRGYAWSAIMCPSAR